MNCTICKHNGNCKMWQDEKEYFEKMKNIPPTVLHRMFEVTEQGARCNYFEEK